MTSSPMLTKRLRSGSFGHRYLDLSAPATQSSNGAGRAETATYQIATAFASKKLSPELMGELRSAVKDCDQTFLACMVLSESLAFEAIFLEEEACTLANYFAQLATEERRRSDMVFEYLFDLGGFEVLHEEPKDEEECASDELKSDPLMALQWVMQRRARHVAKMLDLKWKAENCRETHFLHFARFLDSRLLKAEEETNKKTRQVMLFLERLRREKSVNPKRCSQVHDHEMNGRIST